LPFTLRANSCRTAATLPVFGAAAAQNFVFYVAVHYFARLFAPDTERVLDHLIGDFFVAFADALCPHFLKGCDRHPYFNSHSFAEGLDALNIV
jgi:hypothetical protein